MSTELLVMSNEAWAVMTIDDAQIKVIARAGEQDDYRLRTVIEQLLMSDLFQKR